MGLFSYPFNVAVKGSKGFSVLWFVKLAISFFFSEARPIKFREYNE